MIKKITRFEFKETRKRKQINADENEKALLPANGKKLRRQKHKNFFVSFLGMCNGICRFIFSFRHPERVVAVVVP